MQLGIYMIITGIAAWPSSHVYMLDEKLRSYMHLSLEKHMHVKALCLVSICAFCTHRRLNAGIRCCWVSTHSCVSVVALFLSCASGYIFGIFTMVDSSVVSN